MRGIAARARPISGRSPTGPCAIARHNGPPEAMLRARVAGRSRGPLQPVRQACRLARKAPGVARKPRSSGVGALLPCARGRRAPVTRRFSLRARLAGLRARRSGLRARLFASRTQGSETCAQGPKRCAQAFSPRAQAEKPQGRSSPACVQGFKSCAQGSKACVRGPEPCGWGVLLRAQGKKAPKPEFGGLCTKS